VLNPTPDASSSREDRAIGTAACPRLTTTLGLGSLHHAEFALKTAKYASRVPLDHDYARSGSDLATGQDLSSRRSLLGLTGRSDLRAVRLQYFCHTSGDQATAATAPSCPVAIRGVLPRPPQSSADHPNADASSLEQSRPDPASTCRSPSLSATPRGRRARP